MILTKKRLAAAGLVFLLFLAAVLGARHWLDPRGTVGQEEFSVRFLDVGQGDCALISCGGHMALIDAGPGDRGEQTARQLRALGVRDLELMLISHGHEDHAGGAAALLRKFPAGQLVLPVEQNYSGFWLDMLAAAGETEVTEVTAGWSYRLGDATLTVLYPTEAERQASSNLNDLSLAVRVDYRDVSFWLAGDCETQAEQRMLARKALEPVTVLKVSHHGSRTSTSAGLLEALRPACAVISCAAGNEHGHPHKEVLARLSAFGAEVYRTDTMGTVAFVYENGALRTVTQY